MADRTDQQFRAIVFRPELQRLLPALVMQRLSGQVPLFSQGPVGLESVSTGPLPSPAWARVQTRLAGICGSDLHLLNLRFSRKSANMARRRSEKGALCLGHEAVGVVTETGAGVTRVTRGQRVVLIPGNGCEAAAREPRCSMCARGLPLLCLHRDEHTLPLHCGGGWSEQFVRHESQLMPLPDEVSDEQAVLLDPLACSTHAVLRRKPNAGETVIVIGCGTIGIGMLLSIRALAPNVRIVAIARHGFQAEMARAVGADLVLTGCLENLYEPLAADLGCGVLSKGRHNRMLSTGAAVVYDAVGSGETLHHALRWTQPRGAVVMEGINFYPAPLDRTTIWLREIDVLGAHGHGIEKFHGREMHTFELVLEWIRAGMLKPDALITHRYPLPAYREAIRTADRKTASGPFKVLLEMPSSTCGA